MNVPVIDRDATGIRFVELPHAEQIRSGETALSRLGLGDILRQLLHNPVTPFRSLNFRLIVAPTQ
jgi:hypothetical protein